MQLARVYQGRPSQKTLVLASIDGSDLGEVGATELRVEAVRAGVSWTPCSSSPTWARIRAPARSLQAWSNDSAPRRHRAAADRGRTRSATELGGSEGGSGIVRPARAAVVPDRHRGAGRAARDGLRRGSDLRAAGSCRRAATGRVEAIDEDRLGALGRATLRTLTALDQGPRPEHGPESYVQAVSQVLPGWVLSLLAGTLLLPVLVASVDAFARARGAGRWTCCAWLRWLAAWVAPFLAALALAQFLALVGATPAPPPAPVPPDVLPLDGPALGCARRACSRRWCSRTSSPAGWRSRPDPELREPPEPGAGVALALAIAAAFAAALAREPVRRAAGRARRRTSGCSRVLTRPRRRAALRAVLIAARRAAGAAGGDLLPVRAARSIRSRRLVPAAARDRPQRGARDLADRLRDAGRRCARTVEIAWRLPDDNEAEPRPQGPAVYGPGSYAGPGSLGGTQSALRR